MRRRLIRRNRQRSVAEYKEGEFGRLPTGQQLVQSETAEQRGEWLHAAHAVRVDAALGQHEEQQAGLGHQLAAQSACTHIVEK